MIYFYIFMMLYLEKKYIRSVSSRKGNLLIFFSCFYILLKKEKCQARSNLRGLNFHGLLFVNFKRCFNTSTYPFFYGWFRLSWVTWTKTSRFGSKCKNRPERGPAPTGGLKLFWVGCEFGSKCSLYSSIDGCFIETDLCLI